MTTETLIAIIGAVGGFSGLIELARFYANRKASRNQAFAIAQQAKAEADDKWFAKYEHQLDRMNSQIEIKDSRIEKLNVQLAEKEERFQSQMEAYRDQTKRLRESQDRESLSQQEINRLNAEIIRLTEQNASLSLIIERHKCIKEKCPYKEPATELTDKIRAELGLSPDAAQLPPYDPQPELSSEKIKPINSQK